MKKIILSLFIFTLLFVSVSAQKIGKPTLTPTEPTAAQNELINEGIKLHDQKKYKEAIESYQQVLKENPDCALALYELALSYYNAKMYDKTLETAYKLVNYKGPTGLLGYGLFANVLDDQGKSKEAIEIYQSAIKQLKDAPEYYKHLSSVYYNLGVTYFRQKQYKEAREACKKAIEIDFNYTSPNYMLAEIFAGSNYKIPSMLAAARLISLEINSPRSQRSAKIFAGNLNSAQKDEKGNIQIFLDFNSPKDEGDFGGIDLLLGTLTAIKDDKDKNKSENEIFAEAIDTMIALLVEDKKLPKTFVGKTYIPFLAELKKRGYTKNFAYLILQQNGNTDAEKWLLDNGKTTLEFLNWAKNIQLPTK